MVRTVRVTSRGRLGSATCTTPTTQDGRRGARCVASGIIDAIAYVATAECSGARLVFAAAVVETRDDA